MPGKDTNIGAKRARQLREMLGLECAAPLRCTLSLVERLLGLPVVIAALPDDVAGCCWRDGERVVLWINGLDIPTRQRFTLAHELGHVRCGHDGAMPVDTFVTISGMPTDSREVQANAFAAELLAPASGVRLIVDGHEPGLDDVVRVAATFGISPIAAVYRLGSLGLTLRQHQLSAAVADGAHEASRQRLRAPAVADAISRIRASDLPRLSPSLRNSALAAAIDGNASTNAVADAAGCDPRAIAGGVAWMTA